MLLLMEIYLVVFNINNFKAIICLNNIKKKRKIKKKHSINFLVYMDGIAFNLEDHKNPE